MLLQAIAFYVFAAVASDAPAADGRECRATPSIRCCSSSWPSSTPRACSCSIGAEFIAMILVVGLCRA